MGTDVTPQLRRTVGLEDIYGDLLAVKKEGRLRLGFQNFGGFTSTANDPIDASLRKWVTEMEFDIFGISEVNMYWKKISQALQFKERIKQWWNPQETRASFAYNAKGISTLNSTRQSGGTAQISRGNAALKFQQYGEDPRGLGRWVWHSYRGKDNQTLKVITAYRPIKHNNNGGIYTVWAQHRRYLNQVGKKNLSPTQLILDDLATEIRRWKRAGDHIILMMDCNEDVQSPAMKDFLTKTDMTEAISDRHGGTAPRTYIEGSKQIDGIFITSAVSITAGGFTSFNDGVQGDRADHRCLWVDVKLQTVLGHSMPGPMKFAGRRVKTLDSRVVKKFNQAYKKFAIEHGLSKKIFQLEKEAVYPLPPHLQQLAEQIAELRYQGLAYADKKCRKLYFGRTPFTPEYKKLVNALKFWKIAIRRKEGRKIDSKQLQRILKKAGITTRLKDITALTVDEMKTESKKAYNTYRKYLKKADIARANWLEDLAQARATQQAHKKGGSQRKKSKSPHQASAVELRRLKTQEKSRTLFSRISTAIGKESLAGISLITVPDGTDENGNERWKEVSSHKEIVSALIDTHHKKYHQTEGTPPMQGTLRHQLGYLGVGKEADKILNNEYDEKPGTDPYAATLMKKLHKVEPSLPDLPVGISGREYTEGWNKAKEKTSAGGSILHFGHCKAIAQDPQLADMEAAFLSIPLRSGYSFSQWRRGIDCVLPKKANSFRVDKLRTIVLLEADFNFTNKFVSRKAARRAESTGGFAKEQFGSRKRHRAIDHAWNKQLTLDLLRQLRLPGVLAPNDLKSCYDRICHSIASLCMRRQGVAESEVVCMFSTLQHLEHTIRCAYGDSKETYGKELWAIPMQGVYQGNGAGPVIWAVVSSPVLQIMREAGFGTFFNASISGENIRFVGYAFVDDTDLIQTAKTTTEPIESVLQEMQKGMDMWEGLIRATGGALSIDKGCWWAIDFKWADDGTWKYKGIHDITGGLHAIDFDGIRKPIDRLDVHQAFETLGVFLAPDGNNKAAIEKLQEKATKWAERLRTAHLREQETAVALKATILKTLEYPLLTLHLTEAQCTKIMKPILHAALPKAKFNRNFCRRTLYGPGSHLGVEIHNLHTSQIIEHVDGILRHGPSNSLSGQLLRGSIEAVKLEIGLSGDLFSHSYKQFGHLATDCWVTRTWKELELANVQVIECTKNLQLSKEGDSFIMEKLAVAGYKGIQLARLNRCRLRLQAVSVAELCNGDGTHILPEILNGFNPMLGSSEYSWPKQGNVNETIWRTWSRALRRAYRCNRAGKLPISLGRWTSKSDQNWTAWHDIELNRTFIKNGALWRQFQHYPRTLAGQRAPQEIAQAAEVPSTAMKTVAWVKDNSLHYHKRCRHVPSRRQVYPSLVQTMDGLDTEWKWTVPVLEFPRQGDRIADEIRQGKAMAVADGSFKEQRGTSGFCLTTQGQDEVFYGANEVPGDQPEDHCSYRSELAGILGVLMLCWSVCKTYDVSSGALTIGCDNLASGQHAIEFQDTPRPTDNHFDLLHAIHRIRQDIPVQLTYKHVEGHQREKHPGRSLDQWARLNEKMDALAKAYWLATEDQPRLKGRPLMPNEWRATIDGVRVCKHFKQSLRRQLEGRLLEKKWTSFGKRKDRCIEPLFSQNQISLMDVSSIQKAWDSISGNRRRYVSKLASGYFPIGKYMKRMKYWVKDNCPCCLGRNETTSHMLTDCPDPRMVETRSAAIDQFDTHLKTIRTDSAIRRALVQLARQGMLGERRQPDMEPRQLRQAIATQLHIGLPHFLLGRISKTWSEVQHKAFANYAPWLSGASWAKKVVQGIWNMTFSIWENRNLILHSTDVKDDLLDMDTIDLQIIEEWHNGYEQLHCHDLHLYKGLSLDVLLGKRSHYRREWLAAVRYARDLGDPDLEGDDVQVLFNDTQPNLLNPQSSQHPNLTFPDDADEASDSTITDSSSSDDE